MTISFSNWNENTGFYLGHNDHNRQSEESQQLQIDAYQHCNVDMDLLESVRMNGVIAVVINVVMKILDCDWFIQQEKQGA